MKKIERGFQGSTDAYKGHHLNVALSLCNKADAHWCIGNTVDAITGHNPNPTIATIKLGSVVCRLRYNTGDYYGAIEFLDRALILSCHAHGELIEVYNLLGNASFEVGALAVALKAFQSGLRNLDGALAYFNEARKVIEKTPGPCDYLVGLTTKIAILFQKQKRYSDAERELKAALELCEAMYGARSFYVASSCMIAGERTSNRYSDLPNH
eukprot:scaffold3912_cov205-Chaetoceros_neogracile.AAC.3